MTPERLHRIRAVYEAAVHSPAAARQALLDHECEGDEELRQEVERLLGAREQLPGWLAGPALGMARDAVLEADSTVTQSAPAEHLPFAPGAVLAQRYRIVHLLGRGGMGEVYRAEDLLLCQPVALKFLPAGAASASTLNRFRNEVRTARQVSHPNVCRVYDIGEAAGLTYLSMEYVDGEDLASLLRRIGKLPQGKALEIARQLCAGLAAAHDKGVIHRDLKPANIMLDGRGHVRLTDFGIAGLAAQIRDVRSGTPDYMSPEQLAGKEVTPRSDIDALGIVLCELLTGKRPPLKPMEPGTTTLDSAVERVIERCLDPDPKLRPRSALAVSAALPGGDPLEAALARGETPAPELVANAGAVEGLRPFVAIACLTAVICGVMALCLLRQKRDFLNHLPMENSPEVLAAKARDLAKSFGYTERPVDTIFGWSYDNDYLRYVEEHSEQRSPYPAAVFFWYRQSLHYPVSLSTDNDFTVFRSEMLEPSMQAVLLDSEGRLLELHVRPPVDLLATDRAPGFQWSRLFAAAGLDLARFHEASPELTPAAPFDAQAAWTGTRVERPGEPLRVEAAAYGGRPVFFRILAPWTRPGGPPDLVLGSFSLPMFVAAMILFPTIGALMAWRNASSGRGDRRGAFRLAGFVFFFILVPALADMHHVSASSEFAFLFAALRRAVFAAALSWVGYLAFEPQVRRQHPEALISWSRLLAGRIRDPLVGGHVLVGLALGVGALCVSETFLNPLSWPGTLSGTRVTLPWSSGLVVRFWCFHVLSGAGGGLFFMLLLNLISTPIRRRAVSVAVFILLLTLALTPYSTGAQFALGRSALLFGMIAFALVRFGLVTAATAYFAHVTLLDFPLTTNWSAWYASAALFDILTLVALALYGFATTLSGWRLWPARLDAF